MMIGIFTGLVLGMLTIIILPMLGMPGLSMFGYGIVLLYVLMGVMIGLMGRFERHPFLGFQLHWWMRGPAIGMVFMIVLVLLGYEEISVIMESSLVSWTGLTSPWWGLLDGIFYGGLMGYLETKIAGDGNKLPNR
jgi:peptidoglycan/LPS O-acetylase OafA/YrhL